MFRRVGHKPYFVEVGKIEAIDIDNKEDFVLAEAMIAGKEDEHN
jgi:CMP-N-acetylneuraminic acid synthetase